MGPSADTPRHPGPWLIALGAAALSLVAWAALSRATAVAGASPVLGYALGFAAACGATLAVAATTPLWTWAEALGATVLAAALWLAIPLEPPSVLSATGLAVGLWATGSLVGATLGARIERPGHLAAVALVSSLADVWSVFDPGAPSAQLAARIQAAGPGALSRFVVPWPMLGTPHIDPMLGAGDVVFFALYLGAARAHGLSRRRMSLALGLACAVALALVITLQHPLPLLPLMGVSVLVLEPAARRLHPREWRLLALVCAGVLAALWVRWL